MSQRICGRRTFAYGQWTRKCVLPNTCNYCKTNIDSKLVEEDQICWYGSIYFQMIIYKPERWECVRAGTGASRLSWTAEDTSCPAPDPLHSWRTRESLLRAPVLAAPCEGYVTLRNIWESQVRAHHCSCSPLIGMISSNKQCLKYSFVLESFATTALFFGDRNI